MQDVLLIWIKQTFSRDGFSLFGITPVLNVLLDRVPADPQSFGDLPLTQPSPVQ